MHTGGKLYDEVVAITHQYLGPAADRFVSRIIQSHLHKAPDRLQYKDLKDLITWFSLAMSFLSNDPVIAKEFEAKLRALHAPRGRRQQNTPTTTEAS